MTTNPTTEPHNTTNSPEYNRAYVHYSGQGAPPEEAARLATEFVANNTPSATPKKRTGRTVLIVGAVILAVFGILGVIGSLVPATDNPPASRAPNTSAPAAVVPEPAPEPAMVAPLPANFMLAVKILSKQCFGSAGCNVTFRIEVTEYNGPSLPDDRSFLVTYAVSGVEGGPQVNNFTMTGTQVEYQSEESASTLSAGSILTAKVTEVLE